MQPPLGGNRQAAFLGDGDEVAKMSQLHTWSMPTRYGAQLTKSFSSTPDKPKFPFSHISRASDNDQPLRKDRARHRRLARSEEHTSELQSLAYLVCRLLLEKKKQN